MFPSPLEETGVSNSTKPTDKSKSMIVSVPSRGEWGFLLEDGLNKVREAMRFPSPFEETGVSYLILFLSVFTLLV